MKNLITSMACIMILLVFVLQFTQNQVIHNRITAVDQAANNFKEVVKQQGCIGAENERRLQVEISKILSCNAEDVTVTGNRKAVYRGQMIHYRIEVPVTNLVSQPGFWGLSEEENRMRYRVDRYTTSEYIGR